MVGGTSTPRYQLASALLRRSKITTNTLTEVEARLRHGTALHDLLFSPALLDLAPDIFPPHFVSAFIERESSQGVRQTDTWEHYLGRLTKRRDQSTLRMFGRQIRSAAKADATRRTTTVHPIQFDGERVSLGSLEEQYFVFPEQHAEEHLAALSRTAAGDHLTQLVDRYRQSMNHDVPEAFFTMMDGFREHGLSVQRTAKHKYPVHGLLYGERMALPVAMGERMARAGQCVLDSLVTRLPNPEEAFCFSIDFFLDPDGSIWIGRDVHEQQIGMGLQRQFGVDASTGFYDALAEVLGHRSPDRTIGLSYDAESCRKNLLYRNELAAVREALAERGFFVGNVGSYVLRLFGGTQGVPTPAVTALTDDKLLLDDLLEQHRDVFGEMGVKVPRTYRSTAAAVIEQPHHVTDALGDPRVFIHPTIHHGFKPFEVDLSNEQGTRIIRETFSRQDGPSLSSVPVVAMERIPNALRIGDRQYPHEVRAYFVPRA